MITITEKRLQELENRIPVYEATIAELTKKLEEVNDFPKALRDLERLVDKHNTDVNAYVSKNESQLSDIKRSLDQIEYDKKYSIALTTNNVSDIVALGSTVNAHAERFTEYKTQLDKLRGEHCDTREKIMALEDKSAEHQKIRNELSQKCNENYTKANNAQVDGAAALNKLKAFDGHLNTMKDSWQKAMDSVSQTLIRIDQRIDNLPLPIQPKSYDAEIAEIRKDIATSLSIINSLSSKVSDQTQLIDKVKSLEKAIAELYSLLKQR